MLISWVLTSGGGKRRIGVVPADEVEDPFAECPAAARTPATKFLNRGTTPRRASGGNRAAIDADRAAEALGDAMGGLGDRSLFFRADMIDVQVLPLSQSRA